MWDKNKRKLIILLILLGNFWKTSPLSAAADSGLSFTIKDLEKLGFHEEELNVHSWDRYVRRFRRAHHLTVISGYDYGYWNVDKFGAIREESYKSRGVETMIQYFFHVQLISKFGYYLGSSAGYYSEQQPRHGDSFGRSSAWKLPGLVAGFAYNYNATGRFLLGLETYLSRLTRLEGSDEKGENQTIAVTGETIDFMASWDRFVTLNWGVRVQGHYRKMWVPKPKDPGQDFPVNARISRNSRGVSLGVVHHFL